MDIIQILINAAIIVVGLYLIFESLTMKSKKKVSSFVIDEESLKSCKDVEALAACLSPKLLFLAIVLTLTGIIRLVDHMVYDIGYWNYLVAGIAFMAFLIFYKQMLDAKSKFC